MTDKIDVEVDFGYDEEEEEVPIPPPLVQNGAKTQSLEPTNGVLNEPIVPIAAQNIGAEVEFKVPDAQMHLNAKNAANGEDQKITAGEMYIQEMKKKA